MIFTSLNKMSKSLLPVSQNSTFFLFVETILHPYTQTYQNVITLSAMPTGPLASLVVSFKYSRISEFSGPYGGGGAGCGGLALNRNASVCDAGVCGGGGGGGGGKPFRYTYMCDFDLPVVYSYLLANGYTINTDITRMMLKQKVDYGGGGPGGGSGWAGSGGSGVGGGNAGPVGDAWGGGHIVGGNPKKLLCMVSYGAGLGGAGLGGVGEEWLL
jgi:hypothetical protein